MERTAVKIALIVAAVSQADEFRGDVFGQLPRFWTYFFGSYNFCKNSCL